MPILSEVLSEVAAIQNLRQQQLPSFFIHRSNHLFLRQSKNLMQYIHHRPSKLPQSKILQHLFNLHPIITFFICYTNCPPPDSPSNALTINHSDEGSDSPSDAPSVNHSQLCCVKENSGEGSDAPAVKHSSEGSDAPPTLMNERREERFTSPLP